MAKAALPTIGLVTATQLPLPDPDENAVTAALEKRGATVRLLPWDGAPIDAFHACDVVVIRSTWNYVPVRDSFVTWAKRVGEKTRLFNPAEILIANSDKSYLFGLERASIPVVPTIEIQDLDGDLATVESRGWTDVVIKPRVGAGSFATERFTNDPAGARKFLEENLRERPMLLQPYQPAVEDYGERAIVVIDGVISHAFRKGPRFSRGPLSITGVVDVSPEEEKVVGRVLDHFKAHDLLYARIDLVPSNERLAVMEIELCEPYLMLAENPKSLERFADAIMSRAARKAGGEPSPPKKTRGART